MGSSYKHHLTTILFCGWLLSTFGQQISYELNTNESGSTKSYIARDFVSLKPGFAYTPSATEKLDISIDPGLLFIPTENLYAEPDGTISQRGGAVGAIPGSFSINNTGSATYSIPIECPEGNNNLQPSIALSYNSSARNGIMGWGWNINGLSSITRTGSSLYYDEKASPLQMNLNDNLTLDGQRLLLISGNNLYSDAKYRTEIENYNDITIKRGNYFTYFEAKTKEGVTIEYGSTADSRISANGITAAWLITMIKDNKGNYIRYSYSTDECAVDYSDVRLEKIEYGGNDIAGTPSIYSIHFLYSERPDIQDGYFYNVKITTSRLLSDIIIKRNTTRLRKYTVRYDYNEKQSKVKAIEMVILDGHYNPTQFLWGEQDNTLSVQNLNPANLCSKVSNSFSYADFNGDGRTDFLAYDNETHWLRLYLSDNSQNRFSLKTSVKIDLSEKEEANISTGDFNGDGFCDFVFIKKNKNNCIHRLYTYDGNSFTYRCSMNSSKEALTGDFDGNGKYELLNEETSLVLKFDGSSFVSIGGGNITWGNVAHTSFFANNKYGLNFNGDGKTDVFIMDLSGFRFILLIKTRMAKHFHCSLAAVTRM